MKSKVFVRLIAFCVSASLLAACGARPALPFALPFISSTPTSTPTPTPVPPTSTPRAEGLCSNPLAPVKPGATWTYVIDASGTANTSGFSATITDVRPDGYSMATKWGDNITVTQEWSCKPEGLVALSLGAGQALLGLSLQGIKADLKTSNPTGVTLPAEVKPGSQWTYGLNLAGDLAQGSLSAQMSGSVSTSMQAIGTETVTVPAGTFSAMKIQGTSTFKLTANFHGLGVPLTSVLNSTLWFAPGVGLIRASASGDLAGTALSATTQLQSYNFP